MQIKSLPESERPLEKASLRGIEKLSDAEIVALIIHTGIRNKSAVNLAEEVISLFPEGISGLGECEFDELMSVEGIGKSKAFSIMAAVELGKRISVAPSAVRPVISDAEDVADLFMERLRYVKKEHFKSVLLNTKGEVMLIDDVSIGELSSTVVHPREVFNLAVRKSAASVIFVHNHPSGDPTPSREDIETTRRLAESGELLGIRVLDHIIIGNGKFYSMRESGLIE